MTVSGNLQLPILRMEGVQIMLCYGVQIMLVFYIWLDIRHSIIQLSLLITTKHVLAL